MKARINRNGQDDSKRQEELRTKEMQRKLQTIENEFAKSYGFLPRTVVYAAFDREFNRQIITDYIAEQYYPLNLDMGLSFEEFRAAVVVQIGKEIEAELDAMEHNVSGYFRKQFPDKVFLFSNNLKHNMLVARNTLKHETLHAGIYDLMNGKIPSLKIYKGKQHDDEFFRNLVTEHQMSPLVRNRNNMILKEIGQPDLVFQLYSFEEEFVMFNTACSMLEDEIKATNLNTDNIYNIVSIYLGSSGAQIKPRIDEMTVDVYGKQVPLKNYLKTYFDYLRGPVEGYDEKDKSIRAVLENFETTNVQFEDNGSKIPELLEELSECLMKKQATKENIRKIVNSFCAKYKIGPNYD